MPPLYTPIRRRSLSFPEPWRGKLRELRSELYTPDVALFTTVKKCKYDMGTIAVRVDEGVEEAISRIMREEGLDKSSTVRKLLKKGIAQWKIEKALEKLRNGEVTLWKAAELAGVSLYEMIEIVKEKKVDYIHISPEELEEEIGFGEKE